MLNNDNFINIDLTPEYKRNLKNLAKKYRHIRYDTQNIFVELQKGNFMGDKLSGFELEIYKVRVQNSDIKKGKSGGYRLIYLVESETSILLLTIYSKSEQEDLKNNQIKSIVEEFYQIENN